MTNEIYPKNVSALIVIDLLNDSIRVSFKGKDVTGDRLRLSNIQRHSPVDKDSEKQCNR